MGPTAMFAMMWLASPAAAAALNHGAALAAPAMRDPILVLLGLLVLFATKYLHRHE